MELWLILLFGGIMFFGMLVLLLVLYNRGYMQQLPLQWTGMRYAHDSEPGPIGYENVQIVEETQGAQATRHTKTYAIQPRKTLWDWLQLFLIPLVLALVAVAFNAGQASTSQQLAEQSKQEQVVDNYLNQMSTLLMQYHLHDSQVVDPVRALAQAITLTALDRLDGQHKNIIILFLYRSDILKYHYFKHGETECGDPKVLQKRFSDEQPIITLAQGNVSEVTINNLKLTCIDLHNTHLERSNFATSDLDRADLGLSRHECRF